MISEKGYSIVEASTADQAYAFLDRHSSLDCRFGHLKALTVDGALAVRWLIEFDAANARLSTLEEEHQLAVAARERQTITGLPHSAISL
ncbi:hypothetical protein F4695_004508 [Rhizobium soli]|uniref:Uncharacterized protein n=1 Tax=Rhizobium soli TaxID=424798 RepID=A0A7X0JPR6_9HYPH|nr:hypothetical protein [Rhizobium soli]MBB6511110.1 hypothetical protein [Rhizobium soli]